MRELALAFSNCISTRQEWAAENGGGGFVAEGSSTWVSPPTALTRHLFVSSNTRRSLLVCTTCLFGSGHGNGSVGHRDGVYFV